MRALWWAAGCLCALEGCAARSVEDGAAVPPLQEQATIGAALDGLAWVLALPVPYCLTVERNGHRSEPDSSWLAGLDAHHPVLPQGACPPTYGSMVRAVDSLGRPVDPER